MPDYRGSPNNIFNEEVNPPAVRNEQQLQEYEQRKAAVNAQRRENIDLREADDPVRMQLFPAACRPLFFDNQEVVDNQESDNMPVMGR